MSTVVSFDPDAVRSLTDDADQAFGRTFVACYLRMLPERVRRVALTLHGDDHDDTRDAVLSLTVSAATVGAHELAELGREIDRHLRVGDRVAAIAAAVRLPQVADRVAEALADWLG